MNEDERGLDHLMEQNETDLPFLSAYGGMGHAASHAPEAILEALVRYLSIGGCDVVQRGTEASFGFGSACLADEGCQVTIEGNALPLVPSDLMEDGFTNASLSSNRARVSVVFTRWGEGQRRFVERLVEHAHHS